jgi:hypothetical protein
MEMKMKLIGNLEVSGIVKVVFYNTGEAWNRIDFDDAEPVWLSEEDPEKYKTHQNMVKIIRRKVQDPINYRVWFEGGTINVVPEDPEQNQNT